MARRLTEADDTLLSAYLRRDPGMNLFIIGDLEAFGYASDIQDIWADVGENGQIHSLLFRFYHMYIVYSDKAFDPSPYVDILQSDAQFELLQGDARAVEHFVAHSNLSFESERRTYLAQMNKLSSLAGAIDTSLVKQATLADLDRILELRQQISSFSRSANARESLRTSMEAGGSRTFYIEDGQGQMIAAASTAAENSESAMVVGVCTLPTHRKQGYASACVTAVCRDVLNQGKGLCLFYDNPDAGRIYLRLGFEHIGQWLMTEPIKKTRQ